MGNTKIDWADKVWNPITGCSHAGSRGCDNCYAKRMANRLKGRYGYPKKDPFRVTFHLDRLEEPLHWEKPSRIFVCSMGDLFHENIKPEWIDAIWEVMAACRQHTFMVLTKRPHNIEKLLYGVTEECGCRELGGGDYLSNIWLGVSVEDQKTADERIPILLQIPAAHRWVSIEPMLNPIDLSEWVGVRRYTTLDGLPEKPYWKRLVGTPLLGILDWVVCGGETGPGARPLHSDWVRSLRDQSLAEGVPFFFKSWGEWLPVGQKPACVFKPIGKNDAVDRFHLWNDEEKNVSMKIGRKAAGSNLDGKEWREVSK